MLAAWDEFDAVDGGGGNWTGGFGLSRQQVSSEEGCTAMCRTRREETTSPAEGLVPATMPVRDCPSPGTSVNGRLASLTGTERRPVPAVDRGDLVVCHGGACSPNFLLGPEAEGVGHVDLGRPGLADRHADLARAVLSLGWTYARSWKLPFLESYGHPVGQERLAFDTWLWQAE